MSEIPSWVDHALNGDSVRAAKPWRIVDADEGDFVAGKVTERRKTSLTISVEAGTYQGAPLEPGEWRAVRINDSAVVRRWVERDDPQVGDRVAVRLLGHGVRFDVACGVARDEPTPWQ